MHRAIVVLLFAVCAQAQTFKKEFNLSGSVAQAQIPFFSFDAEILDFALRQPPKVKPTGIMGWFTFTTRYHSPTVRDYQWKPFTNATRVTRFGNFEGSLQSFQTPTRHNPNEVTRSMLSLTWTSRR